LDSQYWGWWNSKHISKWCDEEGDRGRAKRAQQKKHLEKEPGKGSAKGSTNYRSPKRIQKSRPGLQRAGEQEKEILKSK